MENWNHIKGRRFQVNRPVPIQAITTAQISLTSIEMCNDNSTRLPCAIWDVHASAPIEDMGPYNTVYVKPPALLDMFTYDLIRLC